MSNPNDTDTQPQTEQKEQVEEELPKTSIELFFEYPEIACLSIKPTITNIDRKESTFHLINRLSEGPSGAAPSVVFGRNGSLKEKCYIAFSAFVNHFHHIPESMWIPMPSKGIFDMGDEVVQLTLLIKKNENGENVLSNDGTPENVSINIHPDMVLVDKFTAALLEDSGAVFVRSDFNRAIVTHILAKDVHKVPKNAKALKKMQDGHDKKLFEFKLRGMKAANEMIKEQIEEWKTRNPNMVMNNKQQQTVNKISL